MDGMLGLAALCLFALASALFADWQRQLLGNFAGNVLLFTEIAVSMTIVVAASLYRRDRRALAVSVAAFGATCLLTFLAWFAHPEQVIDRASDRVGDYELARDNYHLEQRYGEADPNAAIRYRRRATELAARNLEYRAALMRYRGDPAYFRSTFATWTFGILGIGTLATAILAFRRHRREVPLVRNR